MDVDFFFISVVFLKKCVFWGMSSEISMLVCWINLLTRRTFSASLWFSCTVDIKLNSLCILAFPVSMVDETLSDAIMPMCVHMEVQFTGLKTFIIYNWTYNRITVSLQDIYTAYNPTFVRFLKFSDDE